MEINSEHIEKAVHQFYNEGSMQQEVDQWLISAQASPKAWNFSWDLLHPSKAIEAQFYGASTIHMKISRHWHELPHDHYEPLKSKLMEWIINYTSGPSLISSKLCFALASLMVQTIDSSWKNSVGDVISFLDCKNHPNVLPEKLLTILLEILTALPEEFQSMLMATSQRGIRRNCLTSASKTVFQLLEGIFSNMQASSSDVNILCVRCLKSWVHFEHDLSKIDYFFSYLLKASHVDDSCEISLDTFESIIKHPNLSRFPTLINKLLTCVINLEPLLKEASCQSDLDICNMIYHVVATLCETHSKYLLEIFYLNPEHRKSILQVINMMLTCSGMPGQYPVEEICSEMAFSFWYILQDDMMTSEPEKTNLYLRYMVPIYKSLVDILLVKVCYPSEEIYRTWNSEEKNQLRCYRQDIGDTLMYCYNVLKESMLNILLSHISVILQTNKNQQWQELEACLFAFLSISDAVGIEETTFLPSFFTCLTSIPFTNPRVTATTLDSIGAYAEWIGLHPEVLEHVIPLLLLGLKDADVAPSATLSLKKLSRDCRLSVAPYVETILSACQAAFQDTILRSSERIRLVASIGCVLSVLPVPTIMSYLNGVILPCLQKLEEISLQQPSAENRPDLLLSLSMLSMLCSTLDTRLPKDDEDNSEPAQQTNGNEQPPVLIIIQQITPSLIKVGLQWSQDIEIVETICALLRHACSTLFDEFKPVLQTTLELLLQMHQANPSNHCIDLSKQLILLFGQNENEQKLMQSYLQQLSSVTMTFINQDFRNNTDLIETFLQMLNQIIKKQLKFLIGATLAISDIFNVAMTALGLPEVPTVKSSSLFLSGFIHSSREYPVMSDIINKNGEILLGYIFKIIGGEAPRCMVDYTADILLALNKKYYDNMCRWMNTFVIDGSLPSPSVTRQQKEHYSRLILKERTNRRRLLDVVKEYTFLCRGLIGSEYGKQTY